MVKHNMSYSPEHRAWMHMKTRCLNQNCPQYKDYGGRGIKICDRWVHSFENFYADMGEKPEKEYSLERINVNGDYKPNNCKWATRSEQQRNKRFDSPVYSFNGKTLTIVQWARELNINSQTLRDRLKAGWDIEKTLSVKPIKGGNYEK